MVENKPGRPQRTVGMDEATFRELRDAYRERFNPRAVERLHAWDRKMCGEEPRPITRGRPPKPGQTRMFVAAVQHYLARSGDKHAGRTNKGPLECCAAGGSALDVVGAAWRWSYANAEKQWRKRPR